MKLGKPRLVRRGDAAVEQHADVDGRLASPIGKHPNTVAMLAPKPAKIFQYRRRHGHEPFLVAFADDPQQPPGTIDRFDLEPGRFADTQPACIDQAKAAFVGRIAHGRQKTTGFGITERLGQALLPGHLDLFLVNSGQGRFKVSRNRNCTP